MIIKIIGLACLTIILAKSSISQKIKSIFGLSELDETYNVYSSLIQELINCCMCLGFWIGIIATQDILLASIISILAEYIGGKLQ